MHQIMQPGLWTCIDRMKRGDEGGRKKYDRDGKIGRVGAEDGFEALKSHLQHDLACKYR